ncbi:uncharacterized protein QC761_0029710 [Podospora bellae-mahoneyi]|uniref:Uncharacterized protein n=1 Tax=Podospora bellae-mahoneyi TaxID=2093777 RepID=A0ABR0FSP4_9PEZI|nr:hypothetical protein QC761_0029710 [Podospora bellae-mahoneyi]
MPLGDSITDYGCWRAWIYLRLQNDPDLYDSVDLVGGERAGEICDDSEFDRDHEGHPGFLPSKWPTRVELDIVRGKPRTEELLRAYSTLVAQIIPLGLSAEKNEQVKELNKAIPAWAAKPKHHVESDLGR